MEGLKRCSGSRGEDVSSCREDRSEGESRAARGGRTSQTRQVHAAQKRQDCSCDPLLKFNMKLSEPITTEKRLLHFLSGRERGPTRSYLVRESVLEAEWLWVCLIAPLGHNKVNFSHFQSLQEVR